jgi:hypothetical protein
MEKVRKNARRAADLGGGWARGHRWHPDQTFCRTHESVRVLKITDLVPSVWQAIRLLSEPDGPIAATEHRESPRLWGVAHAILVGEFVEGAFQVVLESVAWSSFRPSLSRTQDQSLATFGLLSLVSP